MGNSTRGCKESDTTKRTNTFTFHVYINIYKLNNSLLIATVLGAGLYLYTYSPLGKKDNLKTGKSFIKYHVLFFEKNKGE